MPSIYFHCQFSNDLSRVMNSKEEKRVKRDDRIHFLSLAPKPLFLSCIGTDCWLALPVFSSRAASFVRDDIQYGTANYTNASKPDNVLLLIAFYLNSSSFAGASARFCLIFAKRKGRFLCSIVPLGVLCLGFFESSFGNSTIQGILFIRNCFLSNALYRLLSIGRRHSTPTFIGLNAD